MAGARIQAATSSLHTLVQTLKLHDVLSLCKFDTSTDVLQKFDRNHMIAWRKHVALLNAAPSGGTALYDAIVHSIDALQMHAKPQHDSHQLRVVVLLTDGDDTCSAQHTLDSVIQRVHSCSIANFHLMLLGVAVDAAKYAPLFAADKPNLHYIDVKDTTSDAIRDAFGTVSKKITALQQKLIVRTLTALFALPLSADQPRNSLRRNRRSHVYKSFSAEPRRTIETMIGWSHLRCSLAAALDRSALSCSSALAKLAFRFRLTSTWSNQDFRPYCSCCLLLPGYALLRSGSTD